MSLPACSARSACFKLSSKAMAERLAARVEFRAALMS